MKLKKNNELSKKNNEISRKKKNLMKFRDFNKSFLY